MKRIINSFRIRAVINKINSHGGVCFGGYKNKMMWFVSPHEFANNKEKTIMRYLKMKQRLKFTGNYATYPVSRYDLKGDKIKIFNLV